MAESLRLIIEVDDKGSPVMRKFGAEVGKTADAISSKATPATQKFSTAIDKMGTTFQQKGTVHLTRFEGATASLGATMQKAGVTVAGFATSALGVAAGGAAVGAAFISTVRTIGGFDQSMAGVKAVTRATSGEMESMTRVARELGATTEFTAQQAAGGMEFLGRAGFDTTQIIGAMPATLDLATAGQLDLARSADIASNIMAGFQIPAAQFGKAADVIAATAASANTNVEQLGEGMKFVAPVAGALNISIEDTAAALGVLSNAGIQASAAGTGLRRILSELASPSNMASEALASLGISVTDLDPKMNSITDIVGKLRNANLDAARAFDIFGERGAPAILALTSQVDDLEKLTQTTRNSEGRLKEMAAVMRNTLPGAGKEFMSAIQEIVLATGDAGLTAILRGAIEVGTALARTFGVMVKAGGDLIGGVAGLVSSVAGFIAPASSAKTILGDLTGVTEESWRETRNLEKAYKALGLEMPLTTGAINDARIALEKIRQETEKEGWKKFKLDPFGIATLVDAASEVKAFSDSFRGYMGANSQETNRLTTSIDATINRIEELGKSAPLYLEGVSDWMDDVSTTSAKAAATVTTKLVAAFETLGLKAPDDVRKVAMANLDAFSTIKTDANAGVEFLVANFAKLYDETIQIFGEVPPKHKAMFEEMIRTSETFGVRLATPLNKALDEFGLKTETFRRSVVDKLVKDFKLVIDSGEASATRLRTVWVDDVLPKVAEAYGKTIPPMQGMIDAINGQIEASIPLEERYRALSEANQKWIDGQNAANKASKERINNLGKESEAQGKVSASVKKSTDFMTENFGVWKGFFTAFPSDMEGILKALDKYEKVIDHINFMWSIGKDLARGFKEFQVPELQKGVEILKDKLFQLELQTWDTNRATKELGKTFGFTTGQAKGLAQAYEILGVKSSAELKQMADRSVLAFQSIQGAGTESASRLAEIWLNTVAPQLADAFGQNIPNALDQTTQSFQHQATELELVQSQWEALGNTATSVSLQLGSIPASTRFPGSGGISRFASGGSVGGIGRRDTVPALLTPGEFVVSAPAARSVGTAALQRLNQGGTVGGAGGARVNVTVNLTVTGIDPRHLDARRITQELAPAINEAIRTKAIKVS